MSTSTSSTAGGNTGDQPTATATTATTRTRSTAARCWAFLATHPQETLVCLCFVTGLLIVILSATNLAPSRARHRGGGAAVLVLTGTLLMAVPPAIALLLFVGGFFEPDTSTEEDPWWAFLPACTWDLLRCLCLLLGLVVVSVSATTTPLTWQSKAVVAAGAFLMAMPVLVSLMSIYCSGGSSAAGSSKTVQAAGEEEQAADAPEMTPPQGSPAVEMGAAERVLKRLQELQEYAKGRRSFSGPLPWRPDSPGSRKRRALLKSGPLLGIGKQTSTSQTQAQVQAQTQPKLRIGTGQKDGGAKSSNADRVLTQNRVHPRSLGKDGKVDKGSSSSEIVSESED